MKFTLKSLRGFLRRKKLESKLEQPPLIMHTEVPDTAVTVSFSVHTWLEYHHRAQGSYIGEPDMVAWLKSKLRAGDIFWDIGSNVGAYSILAAKLCPGAKVYAFEPFIPTFSHLWENIILNDVSKQVFPVCVGLSDETKPNALAVSDSRAGSAEHQVGQTGGKLQQGILAVKGDDLQKLLGLPSPTLLKLDIDGLEVNAVKGLQGILQNPGLRSAMIEVDQKKSEQAVQKLFEAAGFRRVENPLTKPTNGVLNACFERDMG
ncbi:MAG: FkbM family methyltransferase [Chthoniobacterales bacterium]